MPDADVHNPVWSPDGLRLLYQVRGVKSFIIESGRPRSEQKPHPLPGQQIRNFYPTSWPPDGKLLAGWQFGTQRAYGGVFVYSFTSSHYERLTDFGWNPVWLNDNRRLIFVDMSKMYLLDTLTKQLREIYSIGSNEFRGHAISKDNRRLYYSVFSNEADIHLLPLN